MGSSQLVDSEFNLQPCDKVSPKTLTPELKEFMSHCCHERHYFFEIKKCGTSVCTICTPVPLPDEEFAKIKPFPDPVLKDDGHYKSFDNVYGTETSEDGRPSKQQQRKKLPFYASVQHVRNSSVMLMYLCEECGMWRLVYATRKLSVREKTLLESSLDGLSFSCGSQLQEADLELPQDLLSVVFVRDMQCNDPVEALYYSADNVNICVHCCDDIETVTTPEEYFPQCEECKAKQKIKRRKSKK